MIILGKEDKSPARGRKLKKFVGDSLHKCKEDKSPARGRKPKTQEIYPITSHNVRKISPLQGDGNCDFMFFFFYRLSKEDKSPARGRKPSPNFIDLSCSVRKISPLQGDGNPRTHTVHIQFLTVRKISPLQGDGNFSYWLISIGSSGGKEDKSPARGRKPCLGVATLILMHRKEDKSPARGRKPKTSIVKAGTYIVRKISPLQGDGNSFLYPQKLFTACKEDKSPARGRKLIFTIPLN